MNISKFNQELGKKLARAKNYEKYNNLKDAIKAWLDISEMTLNASKDPNIENSFRNMLIRKTESIIDHVRTLKSKYQKPVEIIKSKSEEGDIDRLPDVVKDKDSSIEDDSLDVKKDDSQADTKDSGPELQKIRKKKNSDYDNLPSGFIQIEPSKDFKIITPNDGENINNLTKKQEDLDTNLIKHVKTEVDNINDDKIIICFACGTENAKNTKYCKNCNTKF